MCSLYEYKYGLSLYIISNDNNIIFEEISGIYYGPWTTSDHMLSPLFINHNNNEVKNEQQQEKEKEKEKAEESTGTRQDEKIEANERVQNRSVCFRPDSVINR